LPAGCITSGSVAAHSAFPTAMLVLGLGLIWSLRPKSLSLALMHQHLGLAIQVLGLGLEGGPWP